MDECHLAFRFLLFTNRVLWGCHLSEQEGKLPKSKNYSILFRFTVSQVNYAEMSLILKKVRLRSKLIVATEPDSFLGGFRGHVANPVCSLDQLTFHSI